MHHRLWTVWVLLTCLLVGGLGGSLVHMTNHLHTEVQQVHSAVPHVHSSSPQGNGTNLTGPTRAWWQAIDCLLCAQFFGSFKGLNRSLAFLPARVCLASSAGFLLSSSASQQAIRAPPAVV